MNDTKRAMRRIRSRITDALNWHEEAAFAGAGHPDHAGYKRYRARAARATLERVVQEELDNASH